VQGCSAVIIDIASKNPKLCVLGARDVRHPIKHWMFNLSDIIGKNNVKRLFAKQANVATEQKTNEISVFEETVPSMEKYNLWQMNEALIVRLEVR